MAQHARPNVTGHIEFFRAHATAFPTVVSRTPRWTSSSTSVSLWPTCTPGSRWTGMALPAPGDQRCASGMLAGPALDARGQVAGGPGRPDIGNASWPLPLQPALLPHVDVRAEHQADEHDHLAQPEQAESPEGHGPREEEDRLDVEDDE